MGPEQVNWDYSTKNIPYPSRKEYRQNLIEKTCKFLKNMRWKALFFLGLITTKQNTHETYGFKSDKNPDPVNEMKEFERRILGMIQNVEFIQLNGKHNNFQSNLSKDIKKYERQSS